MEKRWVIRECPEEEIRQLQEDLNRMNSRVSDAVARLFLLRGLRNAEEARAYFNPDLTNLHDPFLLKDMEAAVTRVMEAIRRRERILVYGDYDVDGTTAVSCMLQFLRTIYPQGQVDYYIPHRYKEGYGVSDAGIRFAIDNGYQLIISLDCGIKSADLVQKAADHGIDFVICDHHLPDEQLPRATAILNPKQWDCPYPFKELCGCGVGFKLIQALCSRLRLPEETWHRYLDLVALSIAADIVPVNGENRILLHYGLKKANENPAPGLKALMHKADLKKTLGIHHLMFGLAPRVNAAGRMDKASTAVDLFIEQDWNEALLLAEQLHSHNDDRKEADSNITAEALRMIEEDGARMDRKSTVLYQPHWHKGVVGIVASRLIDKYYRPTVVLTKSGDDLVAGSARSVQGFNLYEAIHACRDCLIGYGGHYAAAGLTLKPEQVAAFRDRFEEVVAATIRPEQLIPEIRIDAQINFQDFDPRYHPNFYPRILARMEPFGPENPQPVFVSKGVKDTGWSRVVKDNHIRFVLAQNGTTVSGIGFNLAHKQELLKHGILDVVYTIEENTWKEQTQLQIKVLDIRKSGMDT